MIETAPLTTNGNRENQFGRGQFQDEWMQLN
jgi:hypothetical protein